MATWRIYCGATSVFWVKSSCANTEDYLLQAKHRPGKFSSTLSFLSMPTRQELIAGKRLLGNKDKKYETVRENTHAGTEKRAWSRNKSSLNPGTGRHLMVSFYSIIQNFLLLASLILLRITYDSFLCRSAALWQNQSWKIMSRMHFRQL